MNVATICRCSSFVKRRNSGRKERREKRERERRVRKKEGKNEAIAAGEGGAKEGNSPQKVSHYSALGRFLPFFALLKIMVTYISFNEGTRCFLLPTLCARSFVSAGVSSPSNNGRSPFASAGRREIKGGRKRELGDRERGKENRGEGNPNLHLHEVKSQLQF